MSIARSTGALVGTNFATGVSVTNNTTSTGSETDLLGDNASEGEIDLYLVYTFPNSAPTAGGTVSVTCYPSWTAGSAPTVDIPTLFADVAVQNQTSKVFVGTIRTGRYMTGTITNSATGQTITNASLLYVLVKRS
jgi:hypothetical protein